VNKLLLEGLVDAVGFVGGVLLAWWVGRMLGFDPLAAGYDDGSLGGIVLAGLGGGGGVQLARRLRASMRKEKSR
jgi:hypothetical protein